MSKLRVAKSYLAAQSGMKSENSIAKTMEAQASAYGNEKWRK